MSSLVPSHPKLSSGDLVTVLKAAAEPTRLRILVLLRSGELNVKDLMQILRQSQPRLSRHLKLLYEAGLLERFREGSWVYFRLSDRARFGEVATRLMEVIDLDDPVIARDRERLDALQEEREGTAQAYFEAHASEWDRIRSLHVAEREVERAMMEAAGDEPIDLLVDLGTGTGRTLELFADRYAYAIGFDVNQSMLAYARAKLANAGLDRAQARHGDIYSLGIEADSADLVVMHQVLHFLSNPAEALAEAARILKPGGRIVIVDFAPHQMEFLRDCHAHERLGFANEQMVDWLSSCGLSLKATNELPSHTGGDEQLTVVLWLATKDQRSAEPAAVSRPAPRAAAHILEETD